MSVKRLRTHALSVLTVTGAVGGGATSDARENVFKASDSSHASKCAKTASRASRDVDGARRKRLFIGVHGPVLSELCLQADLYAG